MPYYTEAQIEQVRSIDLLSYLQTYEPTELVQVRGNIYCTREHDSLKISNGKWMWWSRGFGGSSALDYLIKVKGMSFMEAMKILTEGENFLHTTDTKVCRKEEYAKRRVYIVNKISKDGYYKPEEIVLMPIPESESKEFLFCVKMYCEM